MRKLLRRRRGVACLLLAIFLALSLRTVAASEKDWQALFQQTQSHPREVIRDSGSAAAAARATGDKLAELRALQRLATAHQFLFELDELKAESERGAALAQELHDQESSCFFLQYAALGMYGRAAKDADKMVLAANRLFDDATALAKKHNYTICQSWIYLNQGKIYNAARRTADSLESVSQAYALFESAGDRFGMASALSGIAAYTLIRNTEQDAAKIRDYLDRSLSLVDPTTFRILAAEDFLLQGHNNFFLKKLGDARTSFEKASSIARDIQYVALLGVAERELADLDKTDKHYREALRHLDEALPLMEKHPDARHYIKGLVLRAEVLVALGRSPEALSTLLVARAVVEKTDDPSSAVLYYSRAAQLHAALGNYVEAYQQLATLRLVEDRLDSLRNQRLSDELKVRFDVRLTESENARLLAERQEADARRVALTLGLALTVVLSLVLFGSTGFYVRKRAADIRTEMAHQKRLAEAEAAANHAKSQFLANMSHELRSPLNAILGFTRLVAREPGLTAEMRSNVQIILRSGEHLFNLINQVLDLSKIEAGRMTLHESVFDLGMLLEELEKMFSLTAQQKNIGLSFERDDTLPRYVRADSGKLQQILINLLSNALKFTRQGGVTLRVGRSGKDMLSFSVIDTGPGISDEEFATLGKPFVQANEGRKSREGTGLGLAISNRFVELMGGKLKLASVHGRGATFTFEIAAPEIANAVELGLARAFAEEGRVSGLAPGQPRYRILAVDDLPDQRHLLASMLRPLGFEVREAANGAEAIEIWKEWQPHLIWMDMRMPVLNGREATRRIKSTEAGKSTVIIALTASSFEDERDEILAAGCDDFLRKPFQEHVLFEQLQRHLHIEFVYERPAVDVVPQPIDAARVAALSAALRERLGAALAGLDVEAVEQAIEDVRAVDADLAESLAVMAATFDYGQMLTLLPAQVADAGQ